MFTGIIQTTGRVTKIQKKADAIRIAITPKKKLSRIAIGDSVAVNGVCLTVVRQSSKSLEFDVVHETLRLTNLSELHTGSVVNLESSLRYGDAMGGHYLLGHIEGKGKILSIQHRGRDLQFRIQFPKNLKAGILPKAYIAVDGMSLTVGKVSGNAFSLHIIPLTHQVTNLSTRKPGDAVNLETDILLKRSTRAKFL